MSKRYIFESYYKYNKRIRKHICVIREIESQQYVEIQASNSKELYQLLGKYNIVDMMKDIKQPKRNSVFYNLYNYLYLRCY